MRQEHQRPQRQREDPSYVIRSDGAQDGTGGATAGGPVVNAYPHSYEDEEQQYADEYLDDAEGDQLAEHHHDGGEGEGEGEEVAPVAYANDDSDLSTEAEEEEDAIVEQQIGQLEYIWQSLEYVEMARAQQQQGYRPQLSQQRRKGSRTPSQISDFSPSDLAAPTHDQEHEGETSGPSRHRRAPVPRSYVPPRSDSMDAYVAKRSFKGDEATPEWVLRYNEEQRLRQQSEQQQPEASADEQEQPQERSGADGGGGDEAYSRRDTGSRSVQLSARSQTPTGRDGYSRQSSRYSTASQFLTEEERRIRSEARRRRVEAEIAQSRPFAPQLSFTGVPQKIAEIPLRHPKAWEDRLHDEYFSRKRMKEEELSLRCQSVREREDMEAFVRHCTFQPQINSSSVLMSRSSDGEHVAEAMFRRERDRQEQLRHQGAAAEKERKRHEERQKRAKVTEDDVHAKLYREGMRHIQNMQEKQVAEDARIREVTSFGAVRNADEMYDASERLYEDFFRKEERNQERYDSYGAQSHRRNVPNITPHPSQGIGRNPEEAHGRLYQHALHRQSDQRRRDVQQMEQETNALINERNLRHHSAASSAVPSRSTTPRRLASSGSTATGPAY